MTKKKPETKLLDAIKTRKVLRPMTLAMAAEDLGITQSYLTLLTQGKRKPGRAVALRIADLFGVDVGEW